MNLIQRILGSFDNEVNGFSAKKLTAFAMSLAYCYAHKFVDANNLVGVLVADGGVICLLFGINEAGKKINGTTPPNNEL